MSNYKGHLIGGCVAYGITLAVVMTYIFSFKDLNFVLAKKHTLLERLPTFLTDVEYTIHHYFPLIVAGIAWIFSQCWNFLIIGLEWLFFTLAGAMFPDIDIKSTSQKYLYGILFISLLALIGKKKFYTVACIGMLSMIPIFSNHRGLFHRPWFVILLPFATWYWLSQSFPSMTMFLFCDMLFFIAGALSHLWLDMGFKMFKVRFF